MQLSSALVVIFFLCSKAMQAQVGIGTTTPAATAQLEVNSSSKGFLPPRLTLAQRDAIAAPEAGLQIWCNNCGNAGEMQVYNGTRWANMIGGIAASLPIPGVVICGETWMTKNLDVAFYRNGDAIPKVTDATEWAALTTGAYCYYNNDSTNYAALYGKLYNWFAVNDSRGLAPAGWHIPNEAELNGLEVCAGGAANAGGALKATGTSIWTAPNTGATNSTGFTALPAGIRNLTGIFFDAGTFTYFWTSKETNAATSLLNYLSYSNSSSIRGGVDKNTGASVRCIKD